MQGLPAVLEQSRVGYVVCERVLEGVLEVWEQARFVEELSRLQPGKRCLQCVVRKVCDGL